MQLTKLFSDDTNFLIGGDNFDLLRVTVTSDFQSFQEWIHASELTINYDPQKSSHSVFTTYFSLCLFLFLVVNRLTNDELLYCKFVSDVRCISFESL